MPFVAQVGAGELYGLADFVLGCDGGGGASCCLYAASETVQVTRIRGRDEASTCQWLAGTLFELACRCLV